MAELIHKFRYLALVSRQLGGGLLKRPPIRLPAGGTEVTGLRDYSPGDDYRAVDWNVCARHDELIVRQYEGEADRHVYLLVDCSRSMGLGTPPKFDGARKAAAALAYVALAGHDRVTVLAFAQRVLACSRPAAGTNQFPHLLRFLEQLAPQEAGTDLTQAARQFVRQPRRLGLAVIVSDFYDPAGFRPGLDILRRAGYLPRVVQVHDPGEAKPAVLGEVELFDVESQTVRYVTVTERHLAAYRQRFGEYRDALREYCATYAMGCVQVPGNLREDELLLRVIGAESSRRAI